MDEQTPMNISLDQQVATRQCPSCQAEMRVVRGSVYDHGQPIGLYLIALQSDDARDPAAHLAVALREQAPKPGAVAVAMRVQSMPDDIGFSLVDWTDSPWRDETYLGRMLDRVDALQSSLKPTFFHVAEHIVHELPDVRDYLGA